MSLSRAGSAAALIIPNVIIVSQLAAGANPPAWASTAFPPNWNTVPLDTVVRNNSSLASLGSNAITLPSGTYAINVWLGFQSDIAVEIDIYNNTDGVSLARSMAQSVGYNLTGSSSTNYYRQFEQLVFVLTASKAVIVREQHAPPNNINAGVSIRDTGSGTPISQANIFNRVELYKVA